MKAFILEAMNDPTMELRIEKDGERIWFTVCIIENDENDLCVAVNTQELQDVLNYQKPA